MRVGGGRDDDDEVSRKLKSMDVDKLENGGGEESPRPAVKYYGWKAMPFIIGNETFEKLGTLGTSANLLVYLTQVFHMRSVDAATLLNGLNGTTSLAPIIGAFLSDAYLGRYLALAIASVASLIVSAAIHLQSTPLARYLLNLRDTGVGISSGVDGMEFGMLLLQGV